MRLASASDFSSPVRHCTDRNTRVPLTADSTYKLALEPRINSRALSGHECVYVYGPRTHDRRGAERRAVCEGGKKGDIKVSSARARPLL
jgi:hypothetical protein